MTVLMRHALFALGLASAPVHGIALADVPVVAPAAPTKGQQLARIVLPVGEHLGIRVLRFSKVYAVELKEDARFVALEKTYPGISESFAVAAREEATNAYERSIALLQDDVAKIYAANFSDAELDKLTAFFQTPTGAAMITLSAASGGDTASEFEADRRAKALAFVQNIDEQGKRDLTLFIQSGLQPKARALAPEISALTARRFDDASNFLEAALPARIDAVIARAKGTAKP
jgi:Uncharacterized protein conserved in bacteria (DUF2059)